VRRAGTPTMSSVHQDREVLCARVGDDELTDISNGDMEATDVAALFDRHRLRIARELRGLTQVQLARDAGSVTSASVSQFENGHTRPSAATLRRLAVALRVPLGFFAAPAHPPDGENASGFFRSLRSTVPRDRQRALAYVHLARELTLQLERQVALPELRLPPPPQPITERTTRDEIEALARATRSEWNIPHGPLKNVVRALERHGIVITRFRVELEKVDAFSVPFPDRPIVALGADKGLRDRSRFDAAHELAHLIMHQPNQAGSKTIETQAHQFAAAFLMPKADIVAELPAEADWGALLKLKAKWHVSIAALLRRANTLGIMNDRTYIQACKTMSTRGWRKFEPGDLGPPESPVLLRRAINLATESGTTLSDLARQAGLPQQDINVILGDGDDGRPRVKL
jgi:Zn-dependent peptidase ImmA (M78 family)/DNA-binding XRE family transcriptional regulator